MSILKDDSKNFGKGRDKAAERKFNRDKPRQGIKRTENILNKLVNLDPYSEHSFDDILRPEEAKAVERIDDKSIFWSQIMRIILTYTRNNDLSVFINAVEILEASMGSEVTKDYIQEKKELMQKRATLYNKQVRGTDGNYENQTAIIGIERGFWLERYKTIINELTRKGLWSLKGH